MNDGWLRAINEHNVKSLRAALADLRTARRDRDERSKAALKFLRERDEAVELLKRWQYDDTICGGPVEATADYLERVHYTPDWAKVRQQ